MVLIILSDVWVTIMFCVQLLITYTRQTAPTPTVGVRSASYSEGILSSCMIRFD